MFNVNDGWETWSFLANNFVSLLEVIYRELLFQMSITSVLREDQDGVHSKDSQKIEK